MSDTAELYVSEVDAFTLRMERDPLLRSTIVAVATFDRAPGWEYLVERVERATRLAPTFREKLVDTPFRLAPPRWVVDPDFDLSWHLRRLRVPEDGGFRAVIEFARTAGMAAFDPERPLWEFTLMEGLPEGHAALVMKVHHALTDGIGGVQLADHVVDLAREPTPLGELPPVPVAHRRGALEEVTSALGHDLQAAARAGTDLLRRSPANLFGALRAPRRTVLDVARTTSSVARFLRPVTRTRSPVMTGRRLQWHYDVLDVPLAPLKAAASSVGGTLNDAFLVGVAGGFRRYHDRHGAEVRRLRLTMPISLRTGDHAIGGNHITLVRFEIPIDLKDVASALREIGRICRAQRDEPAISYSNQIAGLLNLLPTWVTGGMLRHVDLLASNVPGFGADVFVGGARLESFHAFGPTIGASANITLMSYRGTCHLGVTTDTAAVPDPDALMACLRESFDEVIALAG